MTQPGALPIPDWKGVSYAIQRSPSLRDLTAAAPVTNSTGGPPVDRPGGPRPGPAILPGFEAMTGGPARRGYENVSIARFVAGHSTNLARMPPILPLAASLAGQPGTTSYADTAAASAGQLLYRVGVTL